VTSNTGKTLTKEEQCFGAFDITEQKLLLQILYLKEVS
jgi:hypothetical protein